MYFPKLLRKDYTVGLAITETALDDPDQMFFENYICGAERNYTGDCNPEFDKLVDEAIGRAGHRETPRRWSGSSNACWPRTWPGR